MGKVNIEKIVTESKASQGKNELRELLKYLSVKVPDIKVVVEIGTWRGYSAQNWLKAFNPDIVISIESDHETFINLPKMDKRIVVIEGESQSLLVKEAVDQLLHDRPIDFLFIDGDHHYETVKADFLYYSLMVRKGGAIVLHDVTIESHPDVEVNEWWRNCLVMLDGIEVETMKIESDGTGFGIIIN